MKVAVIGSGVAGIVSAYNLGKKNHDVTLLEKNDYLGGHTNTVVISDGPDKGLPVDTGFIVYNEKNYPHFVNFLNELEVEGSYSDMSFAYWNRMNDFKYAYTNLNGLFANRKNIIDTDFWKFLFSVLEFFKVGKESLNSPVNETLQEFIINKKLPLNMVQGFLLPLGSAIWSVKFDEILEFPVQALLLFYDMHGLLSLHDRPRWKTVVGGSHEYIKAFKKRFKGKILLNSPIEKIERTDSSIHINGEVFDRVVIATHADEALKMLQDPTEEEKKLLGSWEYLLNHAIFHTDRSIMPLEKRAWASWNFHKESDKEHHSTTYYMNKLQGLKTSNDYFVTLETHIPIDKNKIIAEFDYHHPVYSNAAFESQSELNKINGKINTYYCGSYFGYGFHEDAVKSAIRLVEIFK
jgi:predicted NAD/FAD-binding protein